MKNIIWHNFATIPSTHTYGLDLVSSQRLEKPVLITADIQTAGYGTNNRSWQSVTGNLLATFCVLESVCKLEHFDLNKEYPTQAITCAMIMQKTVFALTGKRVQIKEPNDLLYEGKKCAGILVSRVEDAFGQSVLCISIGFNCAHAPESTQPTSYVKCHKHELVFSFISLLCWPNN